MSKCELCVRVWPPIPCQVNARTLNLTLPVETGCADDGEMSVEAQIGRHSYSQQMDELLCSQNRVEELEDNSLAKKDCLDPTHSNSMLSVIAKT